MNSKEIYAFLGYVYKCPNCKRILGMLERPLKGQEIICECGTKLVICEVQKGDYEG